jgi:NAD-dependent deacetylase
MTAGGCGYADGTYPILAFACAISRTSGERSLPDTFLTEEGRTIVQAELKRAAERLTHSEHLIAFTGAGVSTPSGIPDFRSVGVGLWTLDDPLRVASLAAFLENPDGFFKWARPLARKLSSARPNAAHAALARLEDAGILRAIITQNVDMLHQRAGSRCVLGVHGHLETLHCLSCDTSESAADYWLTFLRNGVLPRCPQCNRPLKPSAVLYGEALPHDVLRNAQQEALASDAMLVVGSSLEVMPAADLPRLAYRRGALLVIVNEQPTPLDERAEFVFRANAAHILPRLVDLCLDVRRQTRE